MIIICSKCKTFSFAYFDIIVNKLSTILETMQVIQFKCFCYNANCLILIRNLEAAGKIAAHEGRIWLIEQLYKCCFCGFFNLPDV